MNGAKLKKKKRNMNKNNTDSIDSTENSDNSDNSEEPYIKNGYNPDYGDDRICICGHEYYRHFDPYEEMEPVGCKYCECYEFKEKIESTDTDSTNNLSDEDKRKEKVEYILNELITFNSGYTHSGWSINYQNENYVSFSNKWIPISCSYNFEDEIYCAEYEENGICLKIESTVSIVYAVTKLTWKIRFLVNELLNTVNLITNNNS